MEKKANSVVVAFSGGPDSVFLTEWLLEQNYDIVALCHFNHQMDIRNGQNMSDEAFCIRYAQQKNIYLEQGSWNDSNTSEEKARIARYQFLEKARKRHNADWIAVAHHQDDQAETVLLQLCRSGGLKSLTGMKEYHHQKKIWRPLLGYSKSEILSFLEEKNISYCIDSSNAENIFTRNWIRNEIIPLLETRFPTLRKHLADQAKRFQDLEQEIESKAEAFLCSHSFRQGVKCSDFLSQMREVQIEIVRKTLSKKSISPSFLESFFALVHNPAGRKKLFTKYQRFEKRKGKIYVLDLE